MNVELLGVLGTIVVIGAYLPQVHHLVTRKCAWGISMVSWSLWLLAAFILFVYAFLQNDNVFIVVQGIHIVAIITIIISARRSNNVCPYHSDHA